MDSNKLLETNDLSAFGTPLYPTTCRPRTIDIETHTVLNGDPFVEKLKEEGAFPVSSRYANFLSTALGKAGKRAQNPIVFMDIAINQKQAGRITLELRADLCPRTAENFRSLITGERGRHPTDKSVLLHYKGSKIHRVVKDSHCQGGDLMNGDGSWSKSSFAPPAEEFEDENFILRHTGPGVLSMCNRGPNTNGSAFFLSFVELPWMNENHVVFGCVANTESLSVLYEIEHAGTECGRPSSEVLILDCGQLYPL